MSDTNLGINKTTCAWLNKMILTIHITTQGHIFNIKIFKHKRIYMAFILKQSPTQWTCWIVTAIEPFVLKRKEELYNYHAECISLAFKEISTS